MLFPVGNRTLQLSATAHPNAPLTALSSLVVSWSPDNPTSLSAVERAQYVNAKANFLASLSNQLIPMSIMVAPTG